MPPRRKKKPAEAAPAKQQETTHTPSTIAKLPRRGKRIESETAGKRKKKVTIFSLPRELRDEIWQYALVEDTPIDVSAALKQPGLLSVCRSFRAEAKMVWYERNHFQVPLQDWDPDLMHKFGDHIDMATRHFESKAPIPCALMVLGTANGKNLMKWCKKTHEGKQALEVQFTNPRVADGDIVYGATQLAQQLRGVPWQTCEASLLVLRQAFGHANPDWLRD